MIPATSTLRLLVEWAKEVDATGVSFQPVHLWTQETHDELWINQEDLDALNDVSAKLIDMKKQGWPILNSDFTLRMLSTHFSKKPAPEETRPCRVGIRNFWVEANGNVMLCDQYRQQTLQCGKLCLLTCVAKKSLRDLASAGFKLLKN